MIRHLLPEFMKLWTLKFSRIAKISRTISDLKDFKSSGYYENGESVGQKGKGNY